MNTDLSGNRIGIINGAFFGEYQRRNCHSGRCGQMGLMVNKLIQSIFVEFKSHLSNKILRFTRGETIV